MAMRMTCKTCQEMLHYHEGHIGAGPALEMKFKHHKSVKALANSVAARCYLCRAIKSKIPDFETLESEENDSDDTRAVFLTATLKDIRLDRRQIPRLYQLDFRVDGEENAVASFVLEEIITAGLHQNDHEADQSVTTQQGQEAGQPELLNAASAPHSPGTSSAVSSSPQSEEEQKDEEVQEINGTEQDLRSSNTSAPEVLDLAKRWIDECARDGGHISCRPSSAQPYYPTRLVDLREIRAHNDEVLKLQRKHTRSPVPPGLPRSKTFHDELLLMAEGLGSKEAKRRVHLISRRELAGEMPFGEPDMKGRYVTLSHCWGKATFEKLKQDNIEQWQKEGVLVKDLPQTFQDAFYFAAQLEDVRYIWIDAMCIIQDDKQDWLAESARMHEIYQHSYCNISATAASDSAQGLFNERDSLTPWFDEVSLRLEDDLHGGHGERIECKILDLSFWNEIVDHAPVNRRSWVFQERLLAPRVIHWCKDQIAFECREVDIAECVPDGLPRYQGIVSNIIKETKLKSINLQTGKHLHMLRSDDAVLSGKDEIFYLYEIWKNLVEIYSKTEIGFHKDRLIALSGIAKMMASVLESHGKQEAQSQHFPSSTGSQDQYFAGMWRNYMASQLLWHVNEGVGSSRQPLEDTRPKDRDDPTKDIYRAPSFSWASVETPRGVTFAETTDKGLLIRVDVIRLTYQGQKNRDGELIFDEFGLVTDGYLVIRGVLRRIELIDIEASWRARILSLAGFETITTALAVGCIPTLPPLAICIFYWPSNPRAFVASCILLGIILSLLFVALCVSYRRTDAGGNPSAKIREHEGNNRYRWCLLHDTGHMGSSEDDFDDSKHEHRYGTPYNHPNTETPIKSCIECGRISKTKGPQRGKVMQELYLDSPASSPSIFGPDSLVYCVPAAKNDKELICLLLQAVLDGDYGVRYRRIGLAKVSTMFGDVDDIVKPPGRSAVKLGQYYRGPDGDKDGESTICII